MNVTKKYLKLLTIVVLIACLIFGGTLAGLLAVASFACLMIGDIVNALKFFGVAVVLGLMAALLCDLISWLDKKFKLH